MANYVPVPVSPTVRGEPVRAASYNGEGGVRREWWWQAGPVDSCCFCCSLRTGMGVLAAMDIVFNSVWGPDGIVTVEKMQKATEQLYENLCPGEDTTTPPCEDLAKAVKDNHARVDILEEMRPLLVLAGILSILAGLVGLWAVLRRSRCAAKMYMVWWPIKFVGNTTILFMNCSALKAHDVQDDSCNVFWLPFNVLVFLYYLKVAWSFHMRLKMSAPSTASAKSTGNIQQYMS